ncbi:Protein kinase domain protein [Tolypocladium paradoxum]|uniref:non-specific serine/threonine protein kinase n=1 Tax=Tolypocladium paradoxum TaxID=94208 RepID=A0A2S4KNQ1_9HYPO|nr:Protein kinase domain protein [Tolypocladium paradoxum]
MRISLSCHPSLRLRVRHRQGAVLQASAAQRKSQHSHCPSFLGCAFSSMSSSDDSTPDFQFEPIEGVERFEKYRPGGYHPIQIGHTLHDRYRVVHKLGHGTFSTTWLARDGQNQLKNLVAVKVGIADSTTREMDALSALNDSQHASSDGLSKAFIPTLLDHFKVHGPNGIHPCYVTMPARASLSWVKEASYVRVFQPDVARALAAQLVLAVSYMHSRGFVHGGMALTHTLAVLSTNAFHLDLHLGNVLLRLPPTIADMSDEQMYRENGEPRLEPVVRYDGEPVPIDVPSRAVIPIWLGKRSEDIALFEAKIFLTDFGETYSPLREARYTSHTPICLQPPETRFEPTKPLSFSSDIWTLACSIWEILGQKSLFDGLLATEDDITCEQVEALGVPPAEWWGSWEARTNWFFEDGTPKRDIQTLEDRFEDSLQVPRQDLKMAKFDSDERHAILTLMRSMLSFRPEDRPRAEEVVKSAWMQKWALPEFDKT